MTSAKALEAADVALGAEATQDAEGDATWSLRVGRPPLDINLFREEKGGTPEVVRESQRRRKPVDPAASKEDKANQQKAQDEAVAIVDKVIQLDESWVRPFPACRPARLLRRTPSVRPARAVACAAC